MVIYDHIVNPRKYTMKYSGVSGHDGYKLSSNCSEKENVTEEGERETERVHVLMTNKKE